MDAQLKAKWIDALRSGEFQQERQAIGLGKRFCCIGVGGFVCGMEVDGDGWWTNGAARTLGLTENQRDALVEMNDRDGKSFAEIADYIEQNL